MLNRLKKLFHTDNFTYFVRYFAVFTLIFVLMTAVILHLMQSSLYKKSDKNLEMIASNPETLLHLAMARGFEPEYDILVEEEVVDDGTTQPVDREKKTDTFEVDSQLNLTANYHVILYDANGEILNQLDRFQGLSNLELDTKELGEIVPLTTSNPFGEVETYRTITTAIDSKDLSDDSDLDVAYAMVLFNTTQIRSSVGSNESTVIVVMIGFWLVSIFASVYLSVLTVRPIMMSFQKQKEFVENASHELRTPLAVLQNRLESLFREPEATILESSESIASSLDEVRNMRLLTTNLLNLARRDDGIRPEIGEVPQTFFDEVFANYQMMADEHHRILVTDNFVTQSIRTDCTLLKQLMTILFDNALKYSEEDGQISVKVVVKERWLLLTVADDGIGISAEDKKRIFDRFYRVDKARTRQKGGFGLGLSLAQQIVVSLHGSITVADNQPKGTVFEVKLPK